MCLDFIYFVYPFNEVIMEMTNENVKKTKEEHAAGVREHSRKYGFPVKRKEKEKSVKNSK